MEEVFKDVVGFEDYFQISNLGRVFGKRSSKILKPYTEKIGYVSLATRIDGKAYSFRVHRLVAIAFIPNPENKLEVNHKDGNKGNNKTSNLEWSTSSENKVHSNNLGLRKLGTDNPRAKLNKEQIIYIRSSTKTNVALAKELNVSDVTISKVKLGKIYKEYLPIV